VPLLSAYFDESGVHYDPKVVVVGGAIASVASWNTFSKYFSRLLRRHKIAAFHASDFYRSRNEFDGWTLNEKQIFVRSFVRLAHRTVKTVIGHGVKLDDFEKVAKEFPTIKISPYQFCLEKCLAAITNWAQAQKNVPPIAVFVEKGQKTNSKTLRVYRKAVQNSWAQEKFKIASVSVIAKKPAADRFIYPFQLSDLIAYDMYKYHLHKALNSSGDPLIKALLPLVKPKSIYGYFDDPINIQRWFDAAFENEPHIKAISL
jgi:hypothetical protein